MTKCKTLIRSPLGTTILTLIASQPDHPQVMEAVAKARRFQNGRFADLSDDAIRDLIAKSIAKHPATCPSCNGVGTC